jgi:hypothetical protein
MGATKRARATGGLGRGGMGGTSRGAKRAGNRRCLDGRGFSVVGRPRIEGAVWLVLAQGFSLAFPLPPSLAGRISEIRGIYVGA